MAAPVKTNSIKLKPAPDLYGLTGSDIDGPATYEEIAGWYAYDFANSPYFQVYSTALLPIFLKWLAEGYAGGSIESDSAESIGTVDEASKTDASSLEIPGLGITAGSYPLAVSLVNTFLQTAFLLSFAAFGDYGSKRKQFLKYTTYIGAFFVCLNIFCFDFSMWWFAGLIRIGAGVSFIMAGVYYNSFLPILASQHQDLAGVPTSERDDKVEELNDEMSNKGFIAGYCGGLAMLFIVYFALLVTSCDKSKDTCDAFQLLFPVCASIAVVGLWWAGFGTYALSKLKARPGIPLPPGSHLCLGCKATGEAFRLVIKYSHTLKFLLSFMLYSDAVNTVTVVAVLLLEEENNASISSVVFAAILGCLGVFVGAFLFFKVQGCTGISAKALILIQLIIFMVVCVACLGGVVTSLDGYGFYVAMGPAMLVLGSMQAYSRSLYSCLTPVGKEASFFSFYEITDKGSNLIGSAISLVVHNHFKSYLPVFWYLLFAFLASALLLCSVDVDQGMIDAGKFHGQERDLFYSDSE